LSHFKLDTKLDPFLSEICFRHAAEDAALFRPTDLRTWAVHNLTDDHFLVTVVSLAVIVPVVSYVALPVFFKLLGKLGWWLGFRLE